MKVKYYVKKENRNEKNDSFALIEFKEFLNYTIQNNEKYLQLIEEIRQDVKEKGKENSNNYKIIKNGLPAIECHNLSSKSSGDKWQSTQIMCFDIDGISCEKVQKIKQKNGLFNASMISPSGEGIKLFLFVENLDETNFKLVYGKIAEKLSEKLEVEVDTSSNDLNRLCFTGSDFEIYDDTKHDARKLYSPSELREEVEQKQIRKFNLKAKYTDVEYLVNYVSNEGIKLVKRYEEFNKLVFSFASLYYTNDLEKEDIYNLLVTVIGGDKFTSDKSAGGSGSSYSVYEEFIKCLKKYRKDSDNRITIGTFKHLCAEQGVTVPKLDKVFHQHFSQKRESIEDYIKNNYKFGFCKYSKKVLSYDDTVKNYRPNSKYDPTDLFVNYNDNFIQYIKVKEVEEERKDEKDKTYLVTKFIENQKSVRTDKTSLKATQAEWKSYINQIITESEVDTSKILFDQLLEPYKEQNLSKQTELNKFISIFKQYCINDTDQFIEQKMKALLKSVIHKGLGNKAEFCGAFLSKSEGIGKTDMLRKFLFKSFHKFYGKIKLSQDEWKTNDYLSHFIVAEVDEKGVNVNDSNILKALVSSQTEELKDKFSNVMKEKISRATIMFTSNDVKFLKNLDEDDRRYLIFELGKQMWTISNNKIVWAFEKVDFEKLWAEIYQEYLTNPVINIDIQQVKDFNRNYKVKTGYENRNNHLLEAFLEEVEDKENGVPCWITPKDIIFIMQILFEGNFDTSKASKDKIAKHFTDLNYNKKKTDCQTDFGTNIFVPGTWKFSNTEEWKPTRTTRIKININKDVLSQLQQDESIYPAVQQVGFSCY